MQANYHMGAKPDYRKSQNLYEILRLPGAFFQGLFGELPGAWLGGRRAEEGGDSGAADAIAF